MCDCIRNIKTEIAKDKNAVSIEVDGVYPTEHSDLDFITTINVSFRVRNKNGTLRRSRTRDYLVAVYCPFCGKRYKK